MRSTAHVSTALTADTVISGGGILRLWQEGTMPRLFQYALLAALTVSCSIDTARGSPTTSASTSTNSSHATVLILGGGVAGIIAARTLHQHGIDNFKIVEARSELGGRVRDFIFGAPGNQYTVELGTCRTNNRATLLISI